MAKADMDGSRAGVFRVVSVNKQEGEMGTRLVKPGTAAGGVTTDARVNNTTPLT